MVVQGGRKDGKTEADCFKVQVVKKTETLRPDLPPLHCFPRPAANLALQLPSSTHFQLMFF